MSEHENCYSSKLSLNCTPKDRMRVFGGNSNPAMTDAICRHLGIETGQIKCGHFMNNETCVEILESVRGKNVYLVQTCSDPVNDNLMELLVMIHSCKFASATRITAVIPSYFYARQDKKDRSRAPITAKLVADMLMTAGANHIITVELHASQIQGFFHIPVDNLIAEPIFIKYIQENIPNYKDAILVSPDAGGVKRVASIADVLKMDFALIHKERKIANSVASMTIVGNVDQKTVIIVDDMADTCGTIIKASQKLKEAGALCIYAMCVHGIFSGNALEKLNDSLIDSFIITNSLYKPDLTSKYKKLKVFKHTNIKVLDVSPLIAEAIRRTENNESISYLFRNVVNCKKIDEF